MSERPSSWYTSERTSTLPSEPSCVNHEITLAGSASSQNHRISVVSIGNGRVRLAIEAPTSIPVHRFEIANKIQQRGENLVSLGAAVDSLAKSSQTEAAQ